jgi:hypothetical protein
MEHDLIAATENEYAYISEMPPPPATPSPPNSPKHDITSPPPPPPPPPHPSNEFKLKDFEWPELPEFVFELPEKTFAPDNATYDKGHKRCKSQLNAAIVLQRDRDYGSCDRPLQNGGVLVEEVMPYDISQTYYELESSELPPEAFVTIDTNNFDKKFSSYHPDSPRSKRPNSAPEKHSIPPSLV